jgi:hypothetical protein
VTLREIEKMWFVSCLAAMGAHQVFVLIFQVFCKDDDFQTIDVIKSMESRFVRLRKASLRL